MRIATLLIGVFIVISASLVMCPKIIANAAGGAYSSYITSTDTVKFNGKDWYIIEDNSTGAEPTVTLFSKEIYHTSKFNEAGNN